MTQEESEWSNVLTRRQKEELVKASVKSLKALVEAEEVDDLLQDICIVYTPDRSLYLTQKRHLIEVRCWDTANLYGWTKERREYDVTDGDYAELVERYELTPKKIEEIRNSLR